MTKHKVIEVLNRYIETLQRTMDFYRKMNKGEEFQQAFVQCQEAIEARNWLEQSSLKKLRDAVH